MIRDEVREILDTLAETARDMSVSDDLDEAIAQATDEAMSLTPLRLAELAERGTDRKLAVVDTGGRMTLSPDEIKALVGPCSAKQMEKYKKVAREVVAATNGAADGPCPPMGRCVRQVDGRLDCRRCWREYLEREEECEPTL